MTIEIAIRYKIFKNFLFFTNYIKNSRHFLLLNLSDNLLFLEDYITFSKNNKEDIKKSLNIFFIS